VVTGVAVVVAQIFWQALWAVAFGIGEKRGFESTLVIGLRSSGDYFVVIYCAVVVAQLAVRWYTQWQTERLAAARLGEDLAQAHLRALQAQLNPHFLFNALNSIVTLIGRDPALAQTLVVRLADLLRATLKTGESQEVPLLQELEVTRRYLEIEQVRFADRLRVSWPDGEVPSALVPAFALQPLVENALLHGIARQSGPGEVAITTRVASAAGGDHLVLTVRDTGPGLRSGGTASRGTGTGLANLRARLSRLYGDGAVLALHDRPEGGVEAVLRVPLRVPVRAVTEGAVVSGTHTSRVGSSEVPTRR
jgi:LytS/YehU family sensor histidine kinase